MQDLTDYLESILQPTVSKVVKDDEVYILEMPIKMEWYDYINRENVQHTITYNEYHIKQDIEKYFPKGLKYIIEQI